MNIILKIRENLHLVDNVIVSYETEVATISDKEIIVEGRFSRSTGKHVRLISALLNKPIRFNSTRTKTFDKLHYGARCRYSDSLSIKGSISVVEKIKSGCDVIQACWLSWNQLNSKDKLIIKAYWEYVNPGAKEDFNKVINDILNLASIGLYQSSLKGNEIELMNELNI
jgi:hypothetical protein